MSLNQQSFVVISGGTGCNSLINAFLPPRASSTSFILPISDDGGSSSELQRVLGGPAIGDIRSRLVRLIPDSPQGSPLAAIRRFMEYRLGVGSAAALKKEWQAILEGKHWLWKGIPNDRKECIRAFLIHFQAVVLKKAQRGFNWKRASIGNVFLTGASMYLGSLPSAIFLFASICNIPHETSRVIPVINTSSTATIAAELLNGEIIVGQSEISHPPPATSSVNTPSSNVPISIQPLTSSSSIRPSPSASTLLPPPPSPGHGSYYPSRAQTPSLFEGPILGDEEPPHSDYQGSDDDDYEQEEGEDDIPARRSVVSSRKLNGNVLFDKDDESIPPLRARIRRIFYLNAYGSETFPRANPLFLDALENATCLVYSPGSLYTSIVPCLALRQVGTAIRTSSNLKYKILLLNSKNDRETPGYDAIDFVTAVRDALLEHGSEAIGDDGLPYGLGQISDFITHLVYLQQGEIPVDVSTLSSLGITCVPAEADGGPSSSQFNSEGVERAFDEIFSGKWNI
ncbi:UPF0052-domain-containing protein [Meredithblackwellia eburnea MCA 4105]